MICHVLEFHKYSTAQHSEKINKSVFVTITCNRNHAQERYVTLQLQLQHEKQINVIICVNKQYVVKHVENVSLNKSNLLVDTCSQSQFTQIQQLHCISSVISLVRLMRTRLIALLSEKQRLDRQVMNRRMNYAHAAACCA